MSIESSIAPMVVVIIPITVDGNPIHEFMRTQISRVIAIETGDDALKQIDDGLLLFGWDNIHVFFDLPILTSIRKSVVAL